MLICVKYIKSVIIYNMKILANNKHLKSDYDIIKAIECGIKLTGSEVKSIFSSRCQISNSKCIINNSELWAMGIVIKTHQINNRFATIDETRNKKLLLKKSELKKLYNDSLKDKLQIMLENIHFSERKIRCKIVLCKKLKKNDKRQILKKRDFLQKAE